MAPAHKRMVEMLNNGSNCRGSERPLYLYVGARWIPCAKRWWVQLGADYGNADDKFTPESSMQNRLLGNDGNPSAARFAIEGDQRITKAVYLMAVALVPLIWWPRRSRKPKCLWAVARKWVWKRSTSLR